MNSIKIKIINQLKDNYSFILYNDNKDASIIDPAESLPIIEYVNYNDLKIRDIFITHHHKDHTSGIEGIKKQFPEINIHSPSSHIKNTRFVLRNNDEIILIISFPFEICVGHSASRYIFNYR